MKLYVGNLSYSVTESDLRAFFEKIGAIDSVSLITDKFSGQSKGFAFVTMASQADMDKALAENGTEFMGRGLKISEARPQEQRSGGGGRPGGGGGFRGGGGGGRSGGGGGGRRDDRRSSSRY